MKLPRKPTLPPEESQARREQLERRISGSRAFRFTLNLLNASSRLLDDQPNVENRWQAPQHHRTGKTGARIIAVTMVILLLLGSLVPMESSAIAHGKVAVMSHKRTVQHLEGGIIAQILVKEGDAVTEGQPLIILDDTQVRSQSTTLSNQFWAAQAAQARLIAERDGARELQFSPELLKQAETNETLKGILDNEIALFNNRRSSFEAQAKILSLRADQIEEQIEGIQRQITAEERKHRLLTEEVTVVQGLLDKGLAQKSRLLALKRAREESDGLIGKLRASIAESRQRLLQAQTEILGFTDDRMKKNAEELGQNQEILVRKTEESRAKQDVLERVTVRAPSAGIVTGMKYFTVGGVIAPGTPIMDIIPQNDTLLIEAQLPPTDIDVVHQGLKARVMLTAYKSRSTPWLTGKVILVSPDIVTEPETPPYYRIRVEVNGEDLKHLKNVQLHPGMPADVYVLTGARSFIGYLLQPITDSMHKAFREE